jgi:hypothetical protein
MSPLVMGASTEARSSLPARSWVLAAIIYSSLVLGTGLMHALSWSEFQFNHRFHTEKVADDYALKSVYPELGSLKRYAKTLETSDQLWKYMSGDSRYYVAQAHDPASALAPYRYRVFPIWLVRNISGLTGSSINTAFVWTNVLATIAAALLFTQYLLLLGLTPAFAVLGAICFITMPGCAGTIAFPLLEPISFLCTAAIFLFALKRSAAPFMVAAVLGVLTKELLVFSALLWLITAWREGERKWINVLIAAVPILTFVGIRLWLGHGAIEVNYGFDLLKGELPTKYVESRFSLYRLFSFARAVFYAFTFMWLGVFFVKKAPEFLRLSFVIVPLVIAAAFMLSGQVTRVIGVIFPIVIPLFLVMLQQGRLFDDVQPDLERSI